MIPKLTHKMIICHYEHNFHHLHFWLVFQHQMVIYWSCNQFFFLLKFSVRHYEIIFFCLIIVTFMGPWPLGFLVQAKVTSTLDSFHRADFFWGEGGRGGGSWSERMRITRSFTQDGVEVLVVCLIVFYKLSHALLNRVNVFAVERAW